MSLFAEPRTVFAIWSELPIAESHIMHTPGKPDDC
jgi:hypothetical protein